MSYDYNKVVARIKGLNSVSTLKKWRKKAEDLAGISFQMGMVGNRQRYSQRVPLFSEDDLNKFQQVADLKGELGLDQAILQAFVKERDPPKSINERIELLEFVLIDLDEDVSAKITHLYQETKRLKVIITTLEKRIAELEEPPKRKGLFGQKN